MPQQSILNNPTYASSLVLSEVSEQGVEGDQILEAASYRKRNSNGFSPTHDEMSPEQPVDEMILQFGNEVHKVMSCKRRKIENFTKQCNASRERLSTALATQRTGRTLLHEEFKKQVATVLSQWQNDIDRIKENEDKLIALWSQQMKLIAQARVMQTERFKSMRLLHEQYCKSFNDLEMTHVEQHQLFAKESSKELAALQNKFLSDTRNHEVSNIRKSLQSLLYQ